MTPKHKRVLGASRVFNIGVPELILILVVALIIFGPGKLPDVGKALGKAIGEFRRASHGLVEEVTEQAKEVREEVQEATGAKRPDINASPAAHGFPASKSEK